MNRTWNLIWKIFAGLVLSILVVFQAIALRDGNQFSRWLRGKLGVEPKHKRRFITVPLFWGFLAWFGIHITTEYL